MKNLKVKIYGLIPLNRTQFIIVYSLFFVFFITMILYCAFLGPQPIDSDASFFKVLVYKYPIPFFMFFLVGLVLEGVFYWEKFIKAQFKVIEDQKNQIEIHNQQLTQQKEEIIAQRDEIEAQRDLVMNQMETISHQKKEILDSIQYAYRIQCAVLPPMYYVKQCLPSSFILYIPKDVVSGDFYFIEQVEGYTVVAAVDCTGHGVPGAMMSVIGYDLLNQAVKINKLTKPSKILNFLDVGVTEMLRQTNNESGVKDGMDLSLLSIHNQLRTVEYAGAYNPVYFIHKNQLTEVKGDKLPIGVNEDGVADEFTNHAIPASQGDMLYIFSDGYADQFGGSRGKKFKYKQMKELMISIYDKTLDEQHSVLKQSFYEWKGDQEQVDDILLIGVRI